MNHPKLIHTCTRSENTWKREEKRDNVREEIENQMGVKKELKKKIPTFIEYKDHNKSFI